MSKEPRKAPRRAPRGVNFTPAEFHAHVFAMESDAAHRYDDLADQMETHNNREVAGLFRRMAEIERKHADHATKADPDAARPRPATQFHWLGAEAPEAIDPLDLHYMMTPHHALTLALRCEENAVAFFEHVLETTKDLVVREHAKHLVEEEREHVQLIRKWLARYPKPQDGWDEDPDPPVYSE